MKKIMLIFTGGTVCSSPDGEGGKNQSNAKKTGSYLECAFKDSDSPFKGCVEFESRYLPQDILSENMTVHSWNAILKIFKEAFFKDFLASKIFNVVFFKMEFSNGVKKSFVTGKNRKAAVKRVSAEEHVKNNFLIHVFFPVALSHC